MCQKRINLMERKDKYRYAAEKNSLKKGGICSLVEEKTRRKDKSDDIIEKKSSEKNM